MSTTEDIRKLLLLAKASVDERATEMHLREILRRDINHDEAWDMISAVRNRDHIPMAAFRKYYLGKYPLAPRSAKSNPATTPRSIVAPSQPTRSQAPQQGPASSHSAYIPVIIAIIGALATICTALITYGLPLIQATPTPTYIVSISDFHLIARIANDNNQPIQGAKVVVATDQDRASAYSDANGYVSIRFTAKNKEGRLFVESNPYAAFDQIFSLPPGNPMDVRLSPVDPNNRTLTIRISDSQNHLPVEGAELTLFVKDRPYSYITDAKGTTRQIPLAFGDKDEIEADVSIKTAEYEFKHVHITLRAESLQELLIDPTGVIVVPPSGSSAITPPLTIETPTVKNTPTEMVLLEDPTDIPTRIPPDTLTPIPSNTPTLTPIPVPIQPALAYPPNTSSLAEGGVKISWNSITNAAEYFLEYTGPAGGSSGWIAASSFDIGPLSPGTYNWRVKARNLGGESLWSEVWTFYVIHVQNRDKGVIYWFNASPYSKYYGSVSIAWRETWHFQLNTQRSINLEITRTSGNLVPVIYLYNANWSLLGVTNGSADGYASLQSTQPGGNPYYVVIEQAQNTSGDYLLTISCTNNCP